MPNVHTAVRNPIVESTDQGPVSLPTRWDATEI